MDRETIERCARVAESAVVMISIGEPGEGPFTCQDKAVVETRAAVAKAIRALPSEPPASHAIITKLIGFAGHDDGCTEDEPNFEMCTRGYSDTLAEARKFMEGGDE